MIGDETMDKAAVVKQWVDTCRPLLPIQNPLWAFVHNNILLNLEPKPFLAAVREAAALYRARPFESEAFYRRQLESGRIDRRSLGEVLLRSWRVGYEKSGGKVVKAPLDELWREMVGKPAA